MPAWNYTTEIELKIVPMVLGSTQIEVSELISAVSENMENTSADSKLISPDSTLIFSESTLISKRVSENTASHAYERCSFPQVSTRWKQKNSFSQTIKKVNSTKLEKAKKRKSYQFSKFSSTKEKQKFWFFIVTVAGKIE